MEISENEKCHENRPRALGNWLHVIFNCTYQFNRTYAWWRNTPGRQYHSQVQIQEWRPVVLEVVEVVILIVSFALSQNSNKSPEPLIDGPAASDRMSALLPFKNPASGKYEYWICRAYNYHNACSASKALFSVITHKVYCVHVHIS